VLLVKKQDVHLTEMSSLRVIVVSEIKIVGKRIVLTNKPCTSAHPELSL
jgi:hypothetical protein